MRLILLLLLFTSCLFAKDPDNNVVILSASSVHNGNYFASGSSVEISGTVNGDVYVLAEQIIIDGIINGDVLACGGSIDISGRIRDNCRMLGGQILVSGIIGNNVTAAAGSVQMLPTTKIAGNLVAIAGNLDLGSSVGANATIVASNMRLSSHIYGTVQGYMGQLRVTNRAQIDGNLDYRSNAEAWIEPGAKIGGEIVYHPTFVHGLVKNTWMQKVLLGSKLLVLLMNFIYTFVLAVIFLKLFPKNLHTAVNALNKRPLKALTYGITLLILLPLASLILLMTILGVPFALALIALNIIGFYSAKVYTIYWVSNKVLVYLKLKPYTLSLFFCGSLLYFALTSIPVFGTMVAVAAMLFGLGAGVLAQGKRGRFFSR